MRTAGVLNLNSDGGAIGGITQGGAYGGITCSPQELSLTELESLTRLFTHGLKDVSVRDIPKRDLGTNMQTMAWIESQMIDHDDSLFAPPRFRDSIFKRKTLVQRDDITGLGVVYATEALLAEHGKSINGLTFAIQGLGNVGSEVAELVWERGGKIVAVSNSSGAVKNPNGIDIPSLLEHKEATGSLRGFNGGDSMNADELLVHECDVRIPCAVAGVLTRENAGDVKAKFIIEAANYPTDPEADEILSKKEVIVLPDVYANAGGVKTEHFGLSDEAEEEANHCLRKQMNDSLVAIKRICQENVCSLRMGAHVLGISRVAEKIQKTKEVIRRMLEEMASCIANVVEVNCVAFLGARSSMTQVLNLNFFL